MLEALEQILPIKTPIFNKIVAAVLESLPVEVADKAQIFNNQAIEEVIKIELTFLFS